jgi:hypothetical protein
LDVSCSWKPASKDDGWKSCEAIFIVEDRSGQRASLDSPNITLSFKDVRNVRNLRFSYSKDFRINSENYTHLESTVGLEEEKNIADSVSRGIGIAGEEAHSRVGNERIAPFKLSEATFRKKEFYNFEELPMIESKSSTNEPEPLKNLTEEGQDPETILLLNDSLQKSTEQTFPPFSDGENISEQDISGNISITTNISSQNYDPNLNGNPGLLGVSGFASFFADAGDSLVSPNVFAIKARFEIPEYESNQFNFSIAGDSFSGSIDPEVSSCGNLDSENSVYILNQSIEAVGICFMINANNVTLDCQGNRIRYSSTGNNAYAVYSISDQTTIKNCIIAEGNINRNIGVGVYLSSTSGGLVFNNTFSLNDLFDSSIYLHSGTNQSIVSNRFSTISDIVYPIYSSGVSYSLIANNSFSNPTSDSYSIFFGPGSSFNEITGNNFNSEHYTSFSIYINSSDSDDILFNNFTIFGDTDSIVFIDSGTNFNVSYNNFSNYASNAYSVYLQDVSGSQISSNYLLTDSLENAYGVHLNGSNNNSISNNHFYSQGDFMYPASLYSSSNNVIYLNDFQYHANSGSAIYENNSDFTIIRSNNLVLDSAEGYGLYSQNSSFWEVQLNNFTLFGLAPYSCYLDSSSYSNFFRNNYTLFSYNSSGIYFGENSNHNSFFGDAISTFGNSSYCFYFSAYTQGNNLSSVTCNSSGAESYPIYVSGSNNRFSFYDSRLDSNSHYGLLADEIADSGVFEFFNSSIENYSLEGANSTIYFYFYLEILAKQSDQSPISGLNITVYNLSGDGFSGLTDSYGKTAPIMLLGSRFDGSGHLEYYSYNISYPGNTNVILILNLSSNNLTSIILDSGITPTQSSPLVGSLSSIAIVGYSSFTSVARGMNCTALWSCGDWSDCINQKQSRECVNLNPVCINSPPEIQRSCETQGLSPFQKATLFDISLRILKKSLLNSEELSGVIGLINLGIPGKVKVNLTYEINDSSGKIIYKENEIVPVETQLEFIKTINLSNFPNGDYRLSVDLAYEGQKEPARAIDSFSIGEGAVFQMQGNLFFIIVTSSLVLLIIIVSRDFFRGLKFKIKTPISV